MRPAWMWGAASIMWRWAGPRRQPVQMLGCFTTELERLAKFLKRRSDGRDAIHRGALDSAVRRSLATPRICQAGSVTCRKANGY